MKLPELKNRLKNKYIVRVVAGVLTIALVGGGVGTYTVKAEKNDAAADRGKPTRFSHATVGYKQYWNACLSKNCS